MGRFTLYFPEFRDYLLTKDVGLIPFIMENYYGYNGKIICNSIKDNLISNKKYLNNLKVEEIKDNEDLREKLLETDILMVHGIYDHNLTIINYYKSLNPKGKIYLKLDGNLYWLSNINKSMNGELIATLRKCDLITVESRRLENLLNSLWGLNIKFIPNGYYEFVEDEVIDYKNKENVILFAGRIGSPEKYNELLLEAFKKVSSEVDNWRIELVGAVEDSFLIYFNNYLKENLQLRKKVIMVGKQDKDKLKESFKRAKIFCLTSLTEACANVFSESVHNGCYLIAPDVDGAIDIIDYGRYGALFPVKDKLSLEKLLIEVCNDENLLMKNCYKSQIYAKENLSWIKLCKDILALLKEDILEGDNNAK